LRTTRQTFRSFAVLFLVLAGPARAQPAPPPLTVLDVPFISQSEALCGGAAAAMILRYWGERGLTAESFAPLVDRSAAGIRTDTLMADLRNRGWNATGIEGTPDLIARELAQGRPVLTLIEDRPGTFHYVVLVAVTDKALVFHDPARAPFRVMSRQEFSRRWDASDRWMAVVLPGTAGPSQPSAAPGSAFADDGAVNGAAMTSCERAVSEGVRLAQAGDLSGAELALGSALGCPGSGALRELAGVRLLQKQWRDVAELASAAVAEDPADAHAWRLLGTSRFVQNDRDAALAAWNEVGEPRVDLFAVNGLTRTRPRVVERLVGLEPGAVLTGERLRLAERRLAELPSSGLSRIEYVPVSTGLAEVRATVVERPLVPSGWVSYAAIGLTAAARRQVDVASGSPTGGGERADIFWRFWPHRPAVGARFEAPAPWGGLWAVAASREEQPFTAAGLAPAERASTRISTSAWLTSRLRVQADAGSDRWSGLGTFGHVSGRGRLGSRDERAIVEIVSSLWAGRETFSSTELRLTARSSRERRGLVWIGRGGAAGATGGTPLDLWFAGDTGHARSVLLRAHPLLDDGRLRVERLGRRIGFASGEVQRWWRGPAGVAAAGAVFADATLVGLRRMAATRGDTDVGIGARVALPGVAGVFRVDVAKGLRDGATAVTFAYDP
jgi:hypothetical protein